MVESTKMTQGLIKKMGSTGIFVLLAAMLGQGPAFSATDSHANASNDAPPNQGNFALSSPQQPGPLLSFGQTLIGRNYLQVGLDTFSPYHVGGAFDNLNGTLIYGITDNTSLFFNYPIQGDYNTRQLRNAAIEDVTLQLEQALYTGGNRQYQEQATIVGAITLPLHEATTLDQPRGFGTPTYFFGTTYNRTYVDWLVFVSPGMLFTSTSNKIKLGSQMMYQAGIGRNILAVTDQSMVFGLLELDGQYTTKDRVNDVDKPNTGGNLIAITPSLWLSTQNLIVQAGIGYPVVQHLYGEQQKTNYFLITNISWTIR